ncbi:alpha/beta-hydrolase [Microthyrium microscopicum]|uniref:cutinase n=1 Tax=Microthyrium microscopicum TaxID=703497 RepID=A0A6A6U2M5_9PEZI|nr:alpha/beta-hydrolase [Microthyrium microscopicum]
MKSFSSICILGVAVGLGAAQTSPASSSGSSALSIAAEFQAKLDRAHSVSNDLTNGTACKEILLIAARGSNEPGNMGEATGPNICTRLTKIYGARIGCQGISAADGYSASGMDISKAKGTSDSAIAGGVKMFNLAQSKCPSSLKLFTGYSQGAAVMHGAIPQLSADLKKTLVAGVLFGDTRNTQDKGQIPDYPKDQVLILCAPDDYFFIWKRL